MAGVAAIGARAMDETPAQRLWFGKLGTIDLRITTAAATSVFQLRAGDCASARRSRPSRMEFWGRTARSSNRCGGVYRF
jgi:hypothetical protein